MIYLIFPLKLVYLTYKLMTNLKIFQICHNLITYFVTLTSQKKSQLNLIFRTGGSVSSKAWSIYIRWLKMYMKFVKLETIRMVYIYMCPVLFKFKFFQITFVNTYINFWKYYKMIEHV